MLRHYGHGETPQERRDLRGMFAVDGAVTATSQSRSAKSTFP